MNHLVRKDNLIMYSISKFFKEPKHIQEFLNVVEGKSSLSLRLIDWFVTNYARKRKVFFTQEDQNFIVYLSYKAQLKAFSKKQFDPFCRRGRIVFKYGEKEEETTVTTIGQLNFFRWALGNGIVHYVKANRDVIENDMTLYQRNLTKKKDKSKKKQPKVVIYKKNTLLKFS